MGLRNLTLNEDDIGLLSTYLFGGETWFGPNQYDMAGLGIWSSNRIKDGHRWSCGYHVEPYFNYIGLAT